MTTLDEIYATLKSEGLCTDQQDFSIRFLGRSAGYYAYLLSTGARPSPTSLGMLAARIFALVPRLTTAPLMLRSGPLRSAWVSAATMWQWESELQFRDRRPRSGPIL